MGSYEWNRPGKSQKPHKLKPNGCWTCSPNPLKASKCFRSKDKSKPTDAELTKCKGAHHKVDLHCHCNKAREKNKAAHKVANMREAKEACHNCGFFKQGKAAKNRCQMKCKQILRQKGGRNLRACPKACMKP